MVCDINCSLLILGTVDDWARLNIEKESPDVLAIMKFYAALDSCDKELILEENAPEECPTVIKIESENVNGSKQLLSNIVLFILAVCGYNGVSVYKMLLISTL
jgi:hypothetical protein